MDETTNKTLGEYIFELAKGNINVLENIYLIMSRILYSVGNIYYNQKADIEDAIQDLLIELFNKARHFKVNTNACAWIVKIYVNLIKNKWKRQKKEHNYIADSITKLEIESNIENDKYLENYTFINLIFSRLSKQERQLLIYRYWCNCSIGDISAILKRPKSTIESQLKVLEEKIKQF